jgi:hypothetical protein
LIDSSLQAWREILLDTVASDRFAVDPILVR